MPNNGELKLEDGFPRKLFKRAVPEVFYQLKIKEIIKQF